MHKYLSMLLYVGIYKITRQIIIIIKNNIIINDDDDGVPWTFCRRSRILSLAETRRERAGELQLVALLRVHIYSGRRDTASTYHVRGALHKTFFELADEQNRKETNFA